MDFHLVLSIIMTISIKVAISYITRINKFNRNIGCYKTSKCKIRSSFDIKARHFSSQFTEIDNGLSLKLENILKEADMEKLGNALAGTLCESDTVLLKGDLGAGKSTLTRGIIRSLCEDDSLMVTSPTYLLDNIYPLPIFDETTGGTEDSSPTSKTEIMIHHMDLYRLPNGCDLSFLSIPNIFDKNLCIIEWPERLGNFKPTEFIEINLLINRIDEGRTVIISLVGDKYIHRLEDVEAALKLFWPRRILMQRKTDVSKN